MPRERRQKRERFEIRLRAGPLALIVRKLAREHPSQPTGQVRRQPELAQMQFVVADHVDELAPPDDAARGAQVSRTTRTGRLLQVERPQLAELERRQILGACALALHWACDARRRWDGNGAAPRLPSHAGSSGGFARTTDSSIWRSGMFQ